MCHQAWLSLIFSYFTHSDDMLTVTCSQAASPEPLSDPGLHPRGSGKLSTPREGAGPPRPASAAVAGLQHLAEACSQGLRCGTLCCAAHRQALGSHSTSCTGANGYKLRGGKTQETRPQHPSKGCVRGVIWTDFPLGRHSYGCFT